MCALSVFSFTRLVSSKLLEFTFLLHDNLLVLYNHLQMLKSAGFDVIVEDRTDQVCLILWSCLLGIYIFYYASRVLIITSLVQFVKTLRQELIALESKKDDVIRDLGNVGF